MTAYLIIEDKFECFETIVKNLKPSDGLVLVQWILGYLLDNVNGDDHTTLVSGLTGNAAGVFICTLPCL